MELRGTDKSTVTLHYEGDVNAVRVSHTSTGVLVTISLDENGVVTVDSRERSVEKAPKAEKPSGATTDAHAAVAEAQVTERRSSKAKKE